VVGGGKRTLDVFFPPKKHKMRAGWEVVTRLASSTYMPTKIVINCNLKINNLHTLRFLSYARTD
jgi:hypothetical protein